MGGHPDNGKGRKTEGWNGAVDETRRREIPSSSHIIRRSGGGVNSHDGGCPLTNGSPYKGLIKSLRVRRAVCSTVNTQSLPLLLTPTTSY